MFQHEISSVVPSIAISRFNVQHAYTDDALVICEQCGRSYELHSDYCNYCKVEIPDGKVSSRSTDSPKSRWINTGANSVITVGYLLLGLGLGWFTLPIFYVGNRIKRRAARARQLNATTLLESDTRAPVLYLRSFRRDDTRLLSIWQMYIGWQFFLVYSSKFSMTFEEALVEQLFKIAPVIAANDPNKKGSGRILGAARIDLENDWKSHIRALAADASMIVLMLDDSENMRWELDLIISEKKFRKIFLIIPMLRKSKHKTAYLDTYNSLKGKYRFLPHYDPRLVGMFFENNTAYPTVVRADQFHPNATTRMRLIAHAIDGWIAASNRKKYQSATSRSATSLEKLETPPFLHS